MCRKPGVSAIQVAKNTLREFSEDDCSTLASAIAYAAFSFVVMAKYIKDRGRSRASA